MKRQTDKRCGRCKYAKERKISNDGKYHCERYGIMLYPEDLERAYCECFEAQRKPKAE